MEMVNRGKYSLRGLCFVDNQRHSRRRRCVLPGALVGRAVRSSLKAPQRVKTSPGTSCSDGIFADHTGYFASGSGRTWNPTIFGRCPLPPSWCQGVYIE